MEIPAKILTNLTKMVEDDKSIELQNSCKPYNFY